jgi:glycosyltransferase involved in cell wall biosynthesis
MVLLEAMASRTPVVASRVGALPDVIQHGRTGWLAEPENPAALAEAIHDALATGPARREEITRAGYEQLVRKYDLTKTIDTLIGIYLSSVRQGR